MKKLLFYCILVLCTTQFACNLLNARAITPVPVATPNPTETALPTATSAAAETPSSSAVNLNLLKNFTYWLEDYQIQAAFQDGVYDDDQIYSRLVEPVAFGDLNGDGTQDAALILATNGGGSGTFYNLITVLDQNGTPAQVGFASIGDRQIINNLQIAGGWIILDYITQSRSDALCCPSERRLRSYLLETSALRLASEQILDSPDTQATPLPNAILIDQPSMWDRLTIPLQVRGRVSQAPPELKLFYYVTDLNATLLAQGEVPLEGEPGGPGTFAFEIPLDSVSSGLIYVEIVDAADGLLRGRSVVELSVQ
jgi:hypothetical protein